MENIFRKIIEPLSLSFSYAKLNGNGHFTENA